MKSASVGVNEITSGYQYRIKPNNYLLEGYRLFLSLKKNGAFDGCIDDVVKEVYRPGIFKRIFVKSIEFGLPYITAQAMMSENPILFSKILSKKMTKDIEPMILQRNSILISCAGSIGNVRIIDKHLTKNIGSQDIIRVVANDDYGFIYAYLSSNAIYSYLQSQLYGSVVPRIEPEIVKNIPLIKISKENKTIIDNLAKDSIVLREQAADKLIEAKRVLSSFLNIHFNKSVYKAEKVSSVNILNSLQFRLDPPAHISDGVYTMDKVKSRFTFKNVGEINARVYRPGIFKRVYVSNGIPYIKGSEIFMTNPFRRCEQLSKTRTPFIDEMALSEGQILMTCAGSVGDVKMITKEYEDKKAIGSQDIIRIESNDDLYTSEYLFTYFQMPFVYDYIQSMKYGSVIERIEPFHVESIPVVEPTKEISDSISALIKDYMDCTYRAFCAEEKAITMVEQKIEKWQYPTAKA